MLGRAFFLYFFRIIILLAFGSPALALGDLELSLTRFNQYNDPVKGVCYPKPQSSPCPTILSQLVSDDKENRFFGAVKSRYEICKKFIPNEKKSVNLLQDLFSKSYPEVGSYSIKTIGNCVGNKGITTDEIGKFYYYNQQLNRGASTLSQNQIVIAQLLKKPIPSCPSELTMSAAFKGCEAQKKCKAPTNLAALAKNVEQDEVIYKKISDEYKSKKKNCTSDECKVYLERLAGVLVQLNQKNPWFLNDAYMDSAKGKTTQARLQQFFEKMYSAQNKLLNDVATTSGCLHGERTCLIKDMRTTVDKMPIFRAPYGKSNIKNYLNQVMESQQCVEEGALDRDKTAKVLSDSSRDAALTVASMGLGAVPLLAKLGMTGRAITAVRIGGEAFDLGVNSYFASTEWKNAIKSCQSNGIKSVSDGAACNSEMNLLFNQGSSHCMLDASMAVLASLPLGIQFLRAQNLFKAKSAVTNVTSEVAKNAALKDADRVAAFEKIMNVKAGTYSRDPKKYNAILKAHNMSGTVGNLTFSQIRERVSYLSKMGFSKKEIRQGLDKGIFGNLAEQGAGNIAKSSQTVDKAVGSFINQDLKNSRVLQKIDDTKFSSEQSLFKGDNNAGIEIMEYQGKKVFAKIKFPPNDRNLTEKQLKILEENFLNEVSYVKKLSDLGVGPKFHGVFKGPDGKYRIVTDFIDGYEVHLGDIDEVAGKMSLSTVKDINTKARDLIKAGIDPLDIQFRVGADGKAHVIDPEYFGVLRSDSKDLALKDLSRDLEDLRWQKSQKNTDAKAYRVSRDQPSTTVTFHGGTDRTIAEESKKILTVNELKTPAKGKSDSYNYVLLEDGRMVLGKVDNEWQVGVNHKQLAPGTRIVGMGELKVNDANAITFNVGSFSSGKQEINVAAMQEKIKNYFKNHGRDQLQVVDHAEVLVPTRQPSFGELLGYCGNKMFRSRNTSLCGQVDSLGK